MRPKENETVDLRALREAVDEYLDYVESDDFHEDGQDNYENDIFEAALEMFYGKDIWDHVNDKLNAV